MKGTRDAKRQIYIVAGFVLLIYLFVIYQDKGIPNFRDIYLTILAIPYWLIIQENLIPESTKAVFGDFVIFGMVFAFGLAFFAQFVLPLHNGQERWQAVTRLFIYVFGWHGPAASIQNGEIIYRQAEGERRGPGVIIVDTASAAVLRTPTRFTRAIGPGTHFTKRSEIIAGVIDLHRQSVRIGPQGSENPFAIQKEDELDHEFRDRQTRRWETRGQTRDGVEVIPNIVAIFRLDSEYGQGNTEFGYSASSVWRAITYEGAVPEKGKDTQQSQTSWQKQPAYIAADLWRDYLRKFTMSELFALPGTEGQETALEKIQKIIATRMKNPTVDVLDDNGNPTGQKIRSREFYLLKSRGIKMLTVIVNNLRFEPRVEDKLIGQWKAGWLELANRETNRMKQTQSYARHDGERQALKDFATYSSKLLGDYLIRNASTPDQAPDLSHSLELMVRGTLDQCIQDQKLHANLTNEKPDIMDLIEWIRRAA
jgi:hypothetical protein